MQAPHAATAAAPAPLRPWLPHTPLKRLRVYASRSRVYVVGQQDDGNGGDVGNDGNDDSGNGSPESSSSAPRLFHVLKLARQDPSEAASAGRPPRLEAVCTERSRPLTREQVERALRRAHESTPGGLALVARAHAIVGCYRLTEGYSLLLVTRREYVGSLAGGHRVYRVADTCSVPLTTTAAAAGGAGPGAGAGGGASSGVWAAWLGGGTGTGGAATAAAAAAAAGTSSSSSSSAAERRYRKLMAGVDLTRGFYFSYTYCLARTMQRNHHVGSEKESSDNDDEGDGRRWADDDDEQDDTTPAPYDVWSSMFTWNSHLTRPLRDCLRASSSSGLEAGGGWLLPLIHGWWEQRRLSLLGRPLSLTLLSRRSRHFAGTRYRKRGVSDAGHVANEVETEQVVEADGADWAAGAMPLLSSVVQVRGSVPVFWTHAAASAMAPKPDVVVQQFDPTYKATHRHFARLLARFGGGPVFALDLLRSAERRPRETLLRVEHARALEAVGAELAREEEAGGRPRHHNPERLVVHVPWGE